MSTICVDFDGVIHSYKGTFPTIKEIKEFKPWNKT